MSASTNLIALYTITRREIMRIVRIWTQTLIPPVITMTLYFVIFGKLIGSRIGKIEGDFTYMQYIVPGLVMMTIINNSYMNISSSFFGAKFQRSVEEMLVSPMANWAILGGYVIGAVARGLVVGAAGAGGRAVLHLAARGASADRARRGDAGRGHLCAGRLHQRGLREEVRRHRPGADLRHHPADLPRRRVLFDQDAGRAVAA